VTLPVSGVCRAERRCPECGDWVHAPSFAKHIRCHRLAEKHVYQEWQLAQLRRMLREQGHA